MPFIAIVSFLLPSMENICICKMSLKIRRNPNSILCRFSWPAMYFIDSRSKKVGQLQFGIIEINCFSLIGMWSTSRPTTFRVGTCLCGSFRQCLLCRFGKIGSTRHFFLPLTSALRSASYYGLPIFYRFSFALPSKSAYSRTFFWSLGGRLCNVSICLRMFGVMSSLVLFNVLSPSR
jgi:hypothetical protein